MKRNSSYLRTTTCYLQITVAVLIYIILSFFANFLENPFIPGAIIAIYMPIVIIGGHLQGKIPGLIIGVLATSLTTLIKLFLNDPNFIFELASIIPHGIMGFIAGLLGDKKHPILSSLSVIPGHLLNVLFFAIFGLIQYSEIIGIYLHIGLIAETMLNISIIIFGIRLLENYFYNKNRLKIKIKFLSKIKEGGLRISHRYLFYILKIGFLTSILLLITISVYGIGYRIEDTRFYLILYLIPIMLAGYWFGLNGSLALSVIISILIAHEIFFPPVHEFNKIFDQIAFFILFFNLIAIIIGELKNKWETSREKLEEMKFQEEKYQKMLAHFLSNNLQSSLFNLQLFKNKYKTSEVFDQKLINDAIQKIKLSSVTSKKVNNIISLLERDQLFEEKWQNILTTVKKVIEDFRQKKGNVEFNLKTPENLNWSLLSDENLKKIFKELFSFLLKFEEVVKITIQGETTKKLRIISIKGDNAPRISTKACNKLTNKITENWIYHGYYLRISHAAIIIQHYNGAIDIIPDESGLEFKIKFPIHNSRDYQS